MLFVTLVDDHVLLRQGLSQLINTFPNYRVMFEADNGKDFIKKLKPPAVPDLVLMDITMPEMNGFETTKWLKVNHPGVKVIALSMMDDEESIIRMLRCGAKGFLLKNTNPKDLLHAMNDVMEKGYHFNDVVSDKVMNNFHRDDNEPVHPTPALSDRELMFLKLSCTELSYREMADEMFISPRTVDSFRDKLFEKLNVKSRVGLVIYAIKNKLVDI